jgi:hypothetical protein
LTLDLPVIGHVESDQGFLFGVAKSLLGMGQTGRDLSQGEAHESRAFHFGGGISDRKRPNEFLR